MKFYKIRKSKIDNLGLYAAKDIKKGTRVIEYRVKSLLEKKLKKTLSMIMIELSTFST